MLICLFLTQETDTFYRDVLQSLQNACEDFSCRHADLANPRLECTGHRTGRLSFEVIAYNPAAAKAAFEEAVGMGIEVSNATVSRCDHDCEPVRNFNVYLIIAFVLVAVFVIILIIIVALVLKKR